MKFSINDLGPVSSPITLSAIENWDKNTVVSTETIIGSHPDLDAAFGQEFAHRLNKRYLSEGTKSVPQVLEFKAKTKAIPKLRKIAGKSAKVRQAREELFISRLAQQASVNYNQAAGIDNETSGLQKQLLADKAVLIQGERHIRDMQLGLILETKELHDKARRGEIDSSTLLMSGNQQTNSLTLNVLQPAKLALAN